MAISPLLWGWTPVQPGVFSNYQCLVTGVNGVLELQFLATQYGYKIANVQHIKVPEPGSFINITSELHIIRQSLVRVIVLNSNGRVAADVLKQVK